MTSPIGYVRLHGRNYEQWFDSDSRNDRYNYLYTEPEVERWKARIDAIARKRRRPSSSPTITSRAKPP